ncbi:hypothetical protein COT72_00915 [archaeon CG10_big_fil_rev_8_21_14_0_10_43_11]|nr:MAG: hypothetical protein COT72_00915 [archaeon CG10_big_fil_rev_8_21_14_0_10_43_11]
MVLIDYQSAFGASVTVGILFGLLIGVRYLVRIERHQKRLLEKVEDLQETLAKTEQKILNLLVKKKPAKKGAK